MNGRRSAVVVVALMLVVAPLLGIGSAPADAHGNHVTAGSQVAADGTVVVEELFILENGYLVIHERDDGDPGKILGHVAIESGYHRGVSVSLDESWWDTAADNESLVAVLHRDAEGGDEFDPDADTPVSAFGSLAGAEFDVREGDKPVSVVATSFEGHAVEDSVTVPRVQLADDGYLVVRANEEGEPGEVIGRERLEGGTHENTTVPVDREMLTGNDSTVYLWVSVYNDDGDGAFDAERDDPVTVAGSPVQSRIVAQLNATESDMSVGVNTPEPTTTGAATSHDTTGASDDANDGTSGGEETDTPAVGVVGTVVAVLLGLLLAGRRR
ncbi:DUF7282 domain-containing protein [Halostella pelagica]|uniref:DUF7282 domain-containing protein n=1 Tax=Halostella pelagica TaxID=2583824 RepID=UPI00108162C1|nr:hypothetical protein [Halostella pelagica]